MLELTMQILSVSENSSKIPFVPEMHCEQQNLTNFSLCAFPWGYTLHTIPTPTYFCLLFSLFTE